ncbi:MAG TPA: hypothetical protein VKG82_02825 [Solirubrobacteraceae bacterium]|nr:hypothetical protein [Solirubrobacteraceae bacterium]
MPQLSAGAVALPTHHVSARIPWNDTDWTGRVCSSPDANHSCTVLKRIKKEKDPIAEQADAGTVFADVSDGVPPCVWERGSFMRDKAATYPRLHPYRNSLPYAHFTETQQRMAPYSLEILPFRWMLMDEHERHTRLWGIEVDRSLEEEINSKLGFTPEWMQDRGNQLALLDSFFSALCPRQSLVLLYAKDLPLVEEREPGARYLVGAGFVDAVDPVIEWEYSSLAPGDLRAVIWDRGVAHSIRPSCSDGFLLPYQQLLKDPDLSGTDLGPFVARAPAEFFDEFSYGSELRARRRDPPVAARRGRQLRAARRLH